MDNHTKDDHATNFAREEHEGDYEPSSCYCSATENPPCSFL